MATNIITTNDVDTTDFGCRAGKLGINWSAIPCDVVVTCSDASDQGNLAYDPITGIFTHTNSNGTTQTAQISLADGFLESVVADPGNPNLVTFTWNTDAGLTPVVIDFSHLDNGLSVLDTDCMDVTITGAGTAVDPWVLSVDPIIDPNVDNALSCTPAGLFAAATLVQVLDTDCVDMTITGAGTTSDPYIISADSIIDPNGDNALSCTPTGLFAAATEVTVLDTTCIDMTLTGTGVSSDPYIVSAAPIIDATVTQNALVCGPDGLSVDIEAWVTAEPFDCSSLPTLP